MDKLDIRQLDSRAREQLRRTVIRLLSRGHTQVAVSAELGINRITINRWAKAHAARGAAGLKEGKRGRPQGCGRSLSPAQEARIQKDLVDHTPDQIKLKFALWNAQAVRALIKQRFLIDLPARTVRKYLARWGFIPFLNRICYNHFNKEDDYGTPSTRDRAVGFCA
jgi:transposase